VAVGLAGAGPTALLTCTVASLCPRTILEKPVEAVYGVVVYACVAYSYFHLFNMRETARRIRILSEIYLAGSLNTGQLLRLYDGTTVLGMRLDRLLATGHLVRQADRFVNVGRGFYARRLPHPGVAPRAGVRAGQAAAVARVRVPRPRASR
jgi:hypothetical protein